MLEELTKQQNNDRNELLNNQVLSIILFKQFHLLILI